MTEDHRPATNERKRGSGVKFVYDVLRDDILDLVLAPGSPIDEIQLAERLSMSRTPIREALVRLASEGLVATLPNRSTVVAPIDFLNMQAFFDALTLMYRVTARLAAQYRTEQNLDLIRAEQARFTRAVEKHDALEMIATNAEFHKAIAAAARNPYFATLSNRLLDEGRRLMRVYYSSFADHLPQPYVLEHEDIIAAIVTQDPAEADRLATAHANQIVSHIKALIARDDRMHVTL